MRQIDRFDRARSGLTPTHIDLGHRLNGMPVETNP